MNQPGHHPGAAGPGQREEAAEAAAPAGTATGTPGSVEPPGSADVTFGDAFHRALRASGLSLQRLHHHLARRGISVSPVTLSHWQRGRSQPGRRQSLQTLHFRQEPASAVIDIGFGRELRRGDTAIVEYTLDVGPRWKPSDHHERTLPVPVRQYLLHVFFHPRHTPTAVYGYYRHRSRAARENVRPLALDASHSVHVMPARCAAGIYGIHWTGGPAASPPGHPAPYPGHPAPYPGHPAPYPGHPLPLSGD
ncbi:hypothetical protein [Streptomyces sennicomposti]